MSDEPLQPNRPVPAISNAKAVSFMELVRFAVLTALIVIPIRLFIAQPFIVSGTSMVPTFEDGEYLIVDELSYRFAPPARGDVVIFRLPIETSKFLIKRVIGLPGETVELSGETVRIKNDEYPDGFVLPEPYVQNTSSESKRDITLAYNEYFVMGDNRPVSADSRLWGPLPKNLIVGRPLFRLFPFSQASYLPGESRYQSVQ